MATATGPLCFGYLESWSTEALCYPQKFRVSGVGQSVLETTPKSSWGSGFEVPGLGSY